jgi:tetratricopeptide (TPR) repeat protein
MSNAVVEKARELAAGGQHAAVVEYLNACTGRELADSPSLALIYGTAQARLGRHQEALPWVELALEQARQGAERALERQALNVRGAIALVSGKIDEAADSFTQALMAASRDGDHATTGRCSNNLGIISNLRGRHAEAIGSWEIAAAAFDRAGLRQGVAECYHNLGITLREQGTLDEALVTAGRAITEAEASGDHSLWAVTLRGRAEIQVAKGELAQARRELARVREIRGRVRDPIGEAEDLRVAASLLVAEGDLSAAELMLREVIGRAEPTGRAHLLAEATRDLALVLRRVGRTADAQAAARTAKAIFTRLGAEGEIRALAGQDWDPAFGMELHGSIAPLHMAQQLADAGHYAQLLTYLGERSQDELEQSPMLTLLCGIAHSRLGRLDLGQHWAVVAQLRARVLRDRPLEVRALNVCGAIALDRGGIDEAVYFFTRAQEEATQDNDLATVGRCSNNLGIIANMRGDYERAAGAYLRAITAYQKAGYARGVAESRHNLAIVYRAQGALDRALEVAEQAVHEAAELGDRQLEAQAVAGLAEVHVHRGRPEQAIREVASALDVHRALKDVVREAEDKRILALALARADQAPEAEALLREVIACATEHKRSWLVATAQRDLAHLLMRQGKVADATAEAQEARTTFERLGAWGELEQLDALLKNSKDSDARVA